MNAGTGNSTTFLLPRKKISIHSEILQNARLHAHFFLFFSELPAKTGKVERGWFSFHFSKETAVCDEEKSQCTSTAFVRVCVRILDVQAEERRKKRGEKKKRARDRSGRKGAYQRAFLVASIHVSSVTRVMSVGNTRFLESNGALPFSLRCSPSPLLFISPPSRSSHSLAPPGKLLHAIYYGLYVHTCTESKARVFGTTSTMDIYTYTYRCICVYIHVRKGEMFVISRVRIYSGMTSPAAYSFVLDTATPTERQMAR